MNFAILNILIISQLKCEPQIHNSQQYILITMLKLQLTTDGVNVIDYNSSVYFSVAGSN